MQSTAVIAISPTYHEFLLDGVDSPLSLGNEETRREEEYLPLLGARLAACLDVECVLGERKYVNINVWVGIREWGGGTPNYNARIDIHKPPESFGLTCS